MKKKYIFLVIGIVMFVVMVIYLGYCVTHPTFLSPFGPLSITYIIYWVYLFAILALFIISFILFRKEKNKKKYEFLCIAFISLMINLILNWAKYQIEDNKILTSTAKEIAYLIIFIIIPVALFLLFVIMLTMSIVTAIKDKQTKIAKKC